jgi:hypothetical protein
MIGGADTQGGTGEPSELAYHYPEPYWLAQESSSPSAVEPAMSANRTVTMRRSSVEIDTGSVA